VSQLRTCLTCGLTFPLTDYPYGPYTGRTHVCNDCTPRTPAIIRVAAVAATHILRCVGASALIDMGAPDHARHVLDGHWPDLHEIRNEAA
jgi:hypothetical protein